MSLPRENLPLSPEDIFGDIPFCVVGGIATRAYMPERHTKGVDFIVNAADFPEAERRLRERGYTRRSELSFSGSTLGLFGAAWEKGSTQVDLLSSHQRWAHEALMHDVRDQRGVRVIALPYLVLMKMDASRGQDQADMERMLGRLQPSEVEEVVAVVAKHLPGDPQAADDVRQYAELGRWEYEQQREDIGDHPQSTKDPTQHP